MCRLPIEYWIIIYEKPICYRTQNAVYVPRMPKLCVPRCQATLSNLLYIFVLQISLNIEL